MIWFRTSLRGGNWSRRSAIRTTIMTCLPEETRSQIEETKFALTEEFYEAYNTHVASVLDAESPTKAEIIAGLRAAADAGGIDDSFDSSQWGR